jgi:hypothetical protein
MIYWTHGPTVLRNSLNSFIFAKIVAATASDPPSSYHGASGKDCRGRMSAVLIGAFPELFSDPSLPPIPIPIPGPRRVLEPLSTPTPDKATDEMGSDCAHANGISSSSSGISVAVSVAPSSARRSPSTSSFRLRFILASFSSIGCMDIRSSPCTSALLVKWWPLCSCS